ncbi:hypothetical protein LTR97_012677 [Elasticomyces elasticus]|uniref:Uncharacterized protein n=1 Tax=Elasticomyces elasticus TaxID=574655 RepID=A0AAN7VKT2_9PEZI|nr:hypothetical protein LTR97_012677 [Elasticomyces elasticus]
MAASELTKPSAPITSQRSDDAPQTSPEEWLQDMNLMHHYSTVVSQSPLLVRDGIAHIWREFVPREALKFNFLLHAMLALSALHLADQHTTDPDTVARYLRLCDRHQSIAIAALRDALTAQFTPENSGAFFALAATTSVSSMARSTILAKLQQPTPFISVDEIAEALTLTKGMREVVGMTAAHTPISVMFTSYRMDAMQERYVQLPTEILTRFAALRDLCEQQCGSTSSPDAMTTPSSASSSDPSNITDTLTPCLVAVTELQDIYLNLRHFMGLSRVETGTIWRWAACLPLDFARLITARHPVALVIVAHFAATTVALRKAWYVQDWGQYALEGIERELEDGMAGWLAWPRECLKGEMAVLLNVSGSGEYDSES